MCSFFFLLAIKSDHHVFMRKVNDDETPLQKQIGEWTLLPPFIELIVTYSVYSVPGIAF